MQDSETIATDSTEHSQQSRGRQRAARCGWSSWASARPVPLLLSRDAPFAFYRIFLPVRFHFKNGSFLRLFVYRTDFPDV